MPDEALSGRGPFRQRERPQHQCSSERKSRTKLSDSACRKGRGYAIVLLRHRLESSRPRTPPAWPPNGIEISIHFMGISRLRRYDVISPPLSAAEDSHVASS